MKSRVGTDERGKPHPVLWFVHRSTAFLQSGLGSKVLEMLDWTSSSGQSKYGFQFVIMFSWHFILLKLDIYQLKKNIYNISLNSMPRERWYSGYEWGTAKSLLFPNLNYENEKPCCTDKLFPILGNTRASYFYVNNNVSNNKCLCEYHILNTVKSEPYYHLILLVYLLLRLILNHCNKNNSLKSPEVKVIATWISTIQTNVTFILLQEWYTALSLWPYLCLMLWMQITLVIQDAQTKVQIDKQ